MGDRAQARPWRTPEELDTLTKPKALPIAISPPEYTSNQEYGKLSVFLPRKDTC